MKIFIKQVRRENSAVLDSREVPRGYVDRLPSVKYRIEKEKVTFLDCFYSEDSEICEACVAKVSVHRRNHEAPKRSTNKRSKWFDTKFPVALSFMLFIISETRPKYQRLYHRCPSSTSQYYPSDSCGLAESECSGTNETTCDVYIFFRASDCKIPDIKRAKVPGRIFQQIYPKM